MFGVQTYIFRVYRIPILVYRSKSIKPVACSKKLNGGIFLEHGAIFGPMFRFLPLVFLAMMAVGCDPASNRGEPEVYNGEIGDSDQAVMVSGRSKIMQVSSPCAVLVVPDYSVPDSLKGTDEAVVDTMFDTNQIALSRVLTFLDSAAFPVIRQQPSGRIEFKNDSSKVYSVVLDGHDWQVLFFNGKNEPHYVELTAFIEQFDALRR